MNNPYIAIGPSITEENGNRCRIVLIHWTLKREFSVHEELFDSIPVDPQFVEDDTKGSLIDGHYFEEKDFAAAIERFANKVKARTAAYIRETKKHKVTVKVV
jgi:hypothetical protein